MAEERELRFSRLVRTIMEKIYDCPSEVAAEDGHVIIDGPDGVDVSLSPDAALETSERLLKGGLMARGQQIEEERRKKPLSPPSG
jgi:hypothetical protein